MPIDLHTESVLSLTAATKAVPRIDGKRPHPSTLWRWCRRGIRGVRLEHVRLGHRVCTSREAIGRFANALAEAGLADQPVTSPHTPKNRTDVQRANAVAAAEAELRAANI